MLGLYFPSVDVTVNTGKEISPEEARYTPVVHEKIRATTAISITDFSFAVDVRCERRVGSFI
jgi:hypothetical protein